MMNDKVKTAIASIVAMVLAFALLCLFDFSTKPSIEWPLNLLLAVICGMGFYAVADRKRIKDKQTKNGTGKTRSKKR